MFNATLLATRLSGRPLLMREAEVSAWASRLLAMEAPAERGTGFMGLFRRAKATREHASAEDMPPRVQAYEPTWAEVVEPGGDGWSVCQGIGLIRIDGPLLDRDGWWLWDYEALDRAYGEMQADPRVRAIFSVHNSPGGVAAQGLPDLGAKLRATRGQEGRKPLWAYCEASYSADYWLASSHDRIIAPGMGGVGSIGCVMTHCDISGGLAQDGIKVTSFVFGAKKTDGTPFAPPSATFAADADAEVEYLGQMFVAEVVAGRPNLTPEAIIATQAGCYMADQSDPARSGLKLGLVDAVMSEQQAFAALLAEINAPIVAPPAPPVMGTKPSRRASQPKEFRSAPP